MCWYKSEDSLHDFTSPFYHSFIDALGDKHLESNFNIAVNFVIIGSFLGIISDCFFIFRQQGISGVTSYTYDALNQLAKVQYPFYTEELYYDKAGNRIRRMAKGVEELYQYDPGNRLTGYTKGGVGECKLY